MRAPKGALLLLLLSFVADASLAAGPSAAEKAIRVLDEHWVAAVAAKDPAKVAGFYAPEGMILPPGSPPATGREAIAKVWEGFFKLKGFHLTFAPTHIRVAKSNDIAYEVGTYRLTFETDKGTVQDDGKYVVAWKKVGRAWKAAADIFNSNGPQK